MEGSIVMAKKKMLSVIIPYYNVEKYLNQLLETLSKQVTDEVEVIVVDDGSDVEFKTDYKWAKVIRQKNGGVSSARNTGLDNAKGQYIAFIDADDNVSDNYIVNILEKAKNENFDYLNLSWKSVPKGIEVILKSVDDNFPFYNRSVWNRVYKKSIIGNTRFNTRKSFGEDAEFSKSVIKNGMKKSFISEFMYYYNTDTPNSLTKKFHNGRLRTRRVVYNFPIVTKNMTFLIKEFEELNKSAEIILMTNQNNLPQLEEYALVTTPIRIHGTELRGYPTKLFMKIELPLKADIVIWTDRTSSIGGIETFNYNLCKQLSKYYSIIVLYRVIDEAQRARLSKFAKVIKHDNKVHIECDTLIINRITDTAPSNVSFKQKVQMVHSCKWAKDLKIPQDNDHLIAVSEAVARTYEDFKKDYKVIHNVTNPMTTNRALIIVSATRTGTNEKGQKRMIALSNLMKKKGIPFIWLCFCDNPIQGANNITFVKPTLDIAPYIKCADYLCQLSDHEGFCYSLVEALELGVPVLVTDLAVLPELGVKDGVNGYIVPWEINDSFDVDKIFHKQLKGTFTYHFDNESRVNQWKEVLGEGHADEEVVIEEETIQARAIIRFDDMLTHERIEKGEIIERKTSRIYDLLQKKFVELVNDEQTGTTSVG